MVVGEWIRGDLGREEVTKIAALQIFQARDDTDSRDLTYSKHFCGGKNLQTSTGERKAPLGGKWPHTWNRSQEGDG